jgi:hypothetical protein
MLPFGNLLKGLKQLLVLLQKVIGLLFKHFACGIRKLHAKPIILAIYTAGKTFFIIKQNRGEFKILFTVRGFYINKGLSNYIYQFQADLIWHDGTFLIQTHFSCSAVNSAI